MRLQLAVAFTGGLWLAFAGSPTRVLAQEATLQEIVVTGTRIARPEFASASPIVSVPAELIQRTSSSTIETTLNSLPQFVPAYGSTSNNPSNGGQGNLQLRGLGSASTLVLLDGRRLVPANGTGVVDVNVIPPSLIESVEIITGGASAVYGSDAIAGVVNFRLKQAVDGVEVKATWGRTHKGDGTEYGGSIVAGSSFAEGRGSLLGYVGYGKRDPVLAAHRDFAKRALAYAGPGTGGVGPQGKFAPLGSPVIEEGIAFPLEPDQAAFDALFASYGYPGQQAADHPYGFGFNADGTVFAQGNLSPRSVLNFRGERDPSFFNDSYYTYNFAPMNYLRLPLARLSAFARLRFDLNDAVELYSQALFADYSVELQLAPTPADDLRMPPTNPFIPPDLKVLLNSRTDAAENLTFHKRLTELGPRQSRFGYDVYQVTTGLHGHAGSSWTYDLYAQLGANDQVERQSGNALRSRIETLTFAADGGTSLCGGFNPFGAHTISAGCAAYIATDATNRAGFDQAIVEATWSGPLLQLPAGAVHAAVGVFYKRDEYHYAGDPIATKFLPDGRPDIAGFTAAADITGDDRNLDAYVETSVPLAKGHTGVQSLEVVAGYRHSQYESAGGADSYKAELLYQPVEPVHLRGSYQHAVRAPSVYELYLPQLPTTFYSTDADLEIDPCEVGSPERRGPDAQQVEALCVAQGLPAERLADYFDPAHDAHGVAGGNPQLEPEAADTVTAGVVFTSPLRERWLRRLQVSLDWYRIEVDRAITTIPASEFIGRCFDRTFNPGFDAGNRWCGMFGRNPDTGEIVDAHEILRNTAGVRTSGLDLQLDWKLDLGPGVLGLNWLASHVDSFERLEAEGIAPNDLVGTTGSDYIGTSFPEWKWNLDLEYAWRSLAFDVRWRHVDSMNDAFVPDLEIPQREYFDIGADYDVQTGFLAGLQLRVGVENLTDEDPPWRASGGLIDASQHDVLGRRYYVSLDYSF